MPAGARNQVRIVGGTWRSRVVTFVPRPDLRPTPDRVRETVFNWLGQDMSGRVCLDLFAGSGALGFEAASRGARSVVMVERDARAYAALQANAAALSAPAPVDGGPLRLVRGDALQFLRDDKDAYDIVFVDPPFRVDVLSQTLAAVSRRLTRDGVVYLESPHTPRLPAGWQVRRHGRAGSVMYQLVQFTGSAGKDHGA